jgi:hypothetical protein
MKDEAAPGLHRPAMMHRHVRRFARIDVELLKQGAKAHSCPFVTDTNADGAILVVDANGNHCPLETRIGHSGHRKQ